MRRRLLILNWRDTRHPEGGGSEVYVEQVACVLRRQGLSGHAVLAPRAGGLPRERAARRSPHRAPRRPPHRLPVGRGPAGARPARQPRMWFSRSRTACPSWPGSTPADRSSSWCTTSTASSGRVVGPALSRLGWLMESRVAPCVNRRCDVRRRLGCHQGRARRPRGGRRTDNRVPTTAFPRRPTSSRSGRSRVPEPRRPESAGAAQADRARDHLRGPPALPRSPT